MIPINQTIEYRINNFPADTALGALAQIAWNMPPAPSYKDTLDACLLHITAYDIAAQNHDNSAAEKLIGFVKVATDGDAHAFLLDPMVHPDYRHQKIGSELVKKATALSRDHGAQWLHVDYEPHLKAFYKGCGFASTNAGLFRL